MKIAPPSSVTTTSIQVNRRRSVSRPTSSDRAQPSGGVPILIVALAGLSMHHGALGAVRSAGRLGISVFHAHPDRRCPIDLSRYSSGSLSIPTDAVTSRKLEILSSFGREHGPALLLAVDDASAVFIGDHASVLEEAFIFPRQPNGLAHELANKRELHHLCQRHAVHTPMATFPASEAELIEQSMQADFPVVIKRIDKSGIAAFAGVGESATLANGATPERAASAIPSVRIVRDHAELLDAYRLMESARPGNVMLQEYIPDGSGANWIFNGYFDAGSQCDVAFTGRKLRQSPVDAGAMTLGVCEPNPEVETVTKRFMQAVGYRGIVDVDYRLDRRDGRYKLLDVNPRIGSSFRLFVADDGTDVLRAMYLDVTGGQVPPAGQPNARRWIVELQDLRSSMTEWRLRELTAAAWARSLRHIDETAWWAADDPQPFIAVSRRLLASRLRRRRRVRAASRDCDRLSQQ
jgi:D-aspartate ligase